MSFKKEVLIHQETCFEREILLDRVERYGFKNLMRVEMFLWDLEIYLHIQKILGDRVVLKGGAAAQFYLPIDYQRTSVDIDMCCFCTLQDVEDVVREIESNFQGEGDLFKFRKYVPVNPLTILPLSTYSVDVPSICTQDELRGTRNNKQEIKVEFMIAENKQNINMIQSPAIFALETDKEYQVLPINDLFADKLTTLGPNTIGIQEERKDEQIKQIFDIYSLMTFHIHELDFSKVRDKFIEVAKVQCESRNIEFNMNEIIRDILDQLSELSEVDCNHNNELSRIINNFQSLYLRRKINRPIAEWSTIGKQLSLLIELLLNEKGDKNILVRMLEIDKILKFENINGPARGQVINLIRDKFILEFSGNSNMEVKILKAKNLNRVFWEIFNIEDAERINYFINNNVDNLKIG